MKLRPLVINIDCENPDYAYEQRRMEALGVELRLLPLRPDSEGPTQSDERIIQGCENAEIVLLERSDKPFPARIIKSLGQCRAIVMYCVGFEGVDVAAASQSGIVVCNAADFCTEEVSDHAVALLLNSARQIMVMDRRVRAGGWQDFRSTGTLRRIGNLTLGLVGFGRIARAVARKMAGFGTRIIATDPILAASQMPPGVELVPLERLLRESDLISVHVPLTAETRGLIGESALSSMKPSALLVNTSRGGVIDQQALVRALRDRKIAGAALDVMAEEPLHASSPLREMDQVILTPHYGAVSKDSLVHLQKIVSDSVEAVLGGYWPPSPVNPKVQPRLPLRPWAEFHPA